MSFFNKNIWKSLPIARSKGQQTHNKAGLQQVSYPPQRLTIRLHSDGSVVGGLTVDDVLPGERDLSVLPRDARQGASGNLVSPGGVHFLTKGNKKWFIKFSELSFLINRRVGVDKPDKPVIQVA